MLKKYIELNNNYEQCKKKAEQHVLSGEIIHYRNRRSKGILRFLGLK